MKECTDSQMVFPAVSVYGNFFAASVDISAHGNEDKQFIV